MFFVSKTRLPERLCVSHDWTECPMGACFFCYRVLDRDPEKSDVPRVNRLGVHGCGESSSNRAHSEHSMLSGASEKPVLLCSLSSVQLRISL